MADLLFAQKAKKSKYKGSDGNWKLSGADEVYYSCPQGSILLFLYKFNPCDFQAGNFKEITKFFGVSHYFSNLRMIFFLNNSVLHY